MTSYLYELPTTGAISFGDFLYDKSASYISEISDTTEARANLRAALKESKRTGDGSTLTGLRSGTSSPASRAAMMPQSLGI